MNIFGVLNMGFYASSMIPSSLVSWKNLSWIVDPIDGSIIACILKIALSFLISTRPTL